MNEQDTLAQLSAYLEAELEQANNDYKDLETELENSSHEIRMLEDELAEAGAKIQYLMDLVRDLVDLIDSETDHAAENASQARELWQEAQREI